MTDDKLTLVITCDTCPEQYDVVQDGVQVGYLRLRHGCFTVDCPDDGGECVYEADAAGDGRFLDSERAEFLTAAENAIHDWLRKREASCQEPQSPAPS
mgnify:CR=1 FL=1